MVVFVIPLFSVGAFSTIATVVAVKFANLC